MFCEEQGVDPAAEFDGRDEEATQVVVLRTGRVVGTCRLLGEGEDCRLGRMAVERAERGGGAGRALVDASIELAREAGCERIVLHAQRRAETFYAGCGFEPVGGTFEEEGIPHVMMRRPVAGEARSGDAVLPRSSDAKSTDTDDFASLDRSERR